MVTPAKWLIATTVVVLGAVTGCSSVVSGSPSSAGSGGDAAAATVDGGAGGSSGGACGSESGFCITVDISGATTAQGTAQSLNLGTCADYARTGSPDGSLQLPGLLGEKVGDREITAANEIRDYTGPGTYETAALGGVVAAGLVALLGVDGALVALGLALPVVGLVLRRPVRAMGAGVRAPEREFVLLRGLALFAPLPVAAVETLALRARTVHADAGSVLITQGEPGDTFYVVADGTVAVDVDGVPRRTQGRGEGFGEIALLRDVPRTATVRAVTPVTLVAVDRDEFLAGVTGG